MNNPNVFSPPPESFLNLDWYGLIRKNNPDFNKENLSAGLVLGGGGFFFKEVIAVIGAAFFAFVFTYVMLVIINYITPVKVSENVEKEGLDAAVHGEKAYDEGAI